MRLRTKNQQHGVAKQRQTVSLSTYERLKSAWLAAHPSADFREIEAANLRIAKQCGI